MTSRYDNAVAVTAFLPCEKHNRLASLALQCRVKENEIVQGARIRPMFDIKRKMFMYCGRSSTTTVKTTKFGIIANEAARARHPQMNPDSRTQRREGALVPAPNPAIARPRITSSSENLEAYSRLPTMVHSRKNSNKVLCPIDCESRGPVRVPKHCSNAKQLYESRSMRFSMLQVRCCWLDVGMYHRDAVVQSSDWRGCCDLICGIPCI